MLLALAAPVAAQNASADFATAYTRVYGDGPPDGVSAAATGLATLQTVAGHWIPGARVFEQPQLAPDTLARMCADGVGLQIDRAGTYGFTLQSLRRGTPEGDIRTFMFATGRYFTTITDLDAHLARLLGNRDPSDVPPQMLLGMMGGTSGIARVELVGDDVLLIDSANFRPMILVRCP